MRPPDNVLRQQGTSRTRVPCGAPDISRVVGKAFGVAAAFHRTLEKVEDPYFPSRDIMAAAAPDSRPAPSPSPDADAPPSAAEFFEGLLVTHGETFVEELASLSAIPAIYPTGRGQDKYLRESLPLAVLEEERRCVERRLLLPPLQRFTEKSKEFLKDARALEADREQLAQEKEAVGALESKVEELERQLAEAKRQEKAKKAAIVHLEATIASRGAPNVPAVERDAAYLKERFIDLQVSGQLRRLKNPSLQQAAKLARARWFTATTIRGGETHKSTFCAEPMTDADGWPAFLAKAGTIITLSPTEAPTEDDSDSTSVVEASEPPTPKRKLPSRQEEAKKQKVASPSSSSSSEEEVAAYIGDIVIFKGMERYVSAYDGEQFRFFHFDAEGRGHCTAVMQPAPIRLTGRRYVHPCARSRVAHTPLPDGSSRTR